MTDLPTEEWLHDNGYEPQWFGLGFIQLRSPDNDVRYHFWHPDLKPTAGVEEIHDHRYDFDSEILAGKLTNLTFEFVEYNNSFAAPHVMEWVSCHPDETEAVPNTRIYGEWKQIGSTTMAAGSSYRMLSSQFHTSSADFAITRLTKLGVRSADRKFARVIRDCTKERTCPFSTPIGVRKLWSLVAECLDRAAGHIDNPGYHLREIPKGVLGEPSKIVEEALELADAHAQGCRIMAAVELSDLHGAVQAYLEKHIKYKPIGNSDIWRMSVITKRAFENGRR